MRTKGLVVGLLLSSMVLLLAPMRAHCVSHDNANNFATHAATEAMQMAQAQQNALTQNNKPSEECYSYVQIFESIEQDPEHAEASAVTPSYEIR